MTIDVRCSGCNYPLKTGMPMRLIDGRVYCLACAADIENAQRCD